MCAPTSKGSRPKTIETPLLEALNPVENNNSIVVCSDDDKTLGDTSIIDDGINLELKGNSCYDELTEIGEGGGKNDTDEEEMRDQTSVPSVTDEQHLIAKRGSSMVGEGKYRSKKNAACYIGPFSHQPMPYRDYKRGFTACDDFNGFYSTYGWKYVRTGSRGEPNKNDKLTSDDPVGWQLVIDVVYFESTLINSWVLYNCVKVSFSSDDSLERIDDFCHTLVDEILEVVGAHSYFDGNLIIIIVIITMKEEENSP